MPRPLVAVYQEYANLSLPTPAQAELNTCVVGVAKQVVDFDPEKVAATQSESGAFPAVQVFKPYGMATGAVLESADVYFVSPEVVVSSQAQVTIDTSDSAVWFNLLFSTLNSDYSDIGTSKYTGVSVGHLVHVRDDLGTWYPLGEITGVDTTPNADGKYVVTLKTGVSDAPVDLRTILLTSAIGEVRVTKKLPDSVKLSGLDVDLDATENTVSIAASAKVMDGKFSVAVHEAKAVCVAYVARRSDLAFIDSVSDESELASKLGKVDKRNPLALAASLTLKNSGSKVFVYGVPEDTVAAYGAFQRAAMPRSDIYCIVPVCLNPLVQKEVVENLKGKVMDMANAETALKTGVPQRFKMVVASGFPSVQDPRLKYSFPLSGTAAAGQVSCTLVATGKYRVIYDGATFVDDGVQVGDVITPASATWFGPSTAKVTKVISNTALLIDKNLDFSANDYKVVRKLDEAEIRDGLAAMPKSIASKRVVMLLGDSVVIRSVAGEEKLSAAYLACAVGGMIAGLPPHSGLTNLYVSGIDDVVGTGDFFSEENLTILSDAGWCVFVEDVPDANPYCIHGVTTDPSALEFSEIMSVKNFDYVSASLSNALGQFIGTWNINESTLGFITASLNGVLSRLQSASVPKLGTPLISGKIDSLGQHATQKDRVEIYVSLNMPKSLNTIGLHLVSA